MRNLLVTIVLAACGSAAPAPVAPAPARAPAPAASPEAERFDFKVRQDFFDGMRGDAAALDRAMALCDKTLAANPNHAEALVWHGAGLVALSRAKFQAGDLAGGRAQFAAGLAEMDRAVGLAPNDPGVRIPRGAVVLAVAAHVPEPQRGELAQRGVADYEATLAVQRARFASLTLHSREQLLYGLTDGYALLGDRAKAQAYYEQMQRAAAGSELLARAKLRADGQDVAGQAPCEQCHRR
ncbi:MAG TPA: hypothetical protein VLX92_21035 [Kofleriaceae bacterium]|nr:hypothetical protein [Kofleriaceae bacterium]